MTTVLVVDDQLTARELITGILDSIGFHVLVATTGEEGIWLAHKKQPDLILCDIEMPEPNGYDVLTALRQNPSTAAIPFIFLTAKADKQAQRQGMELGADDYLTKPFTAEELIGALKARLAKQLTLKRKSSHVLEQLHRGLTSTLPHELRTPLHGIMGLAQLLSMQPIAQNPHEVLEMSGQILQSAERLERMIENLLLYGQLTTNAPQNDYKNRLQTTQVLSVSDGVTGVAQQVAKRYQRLKDLRFDIQGLEIECNAFSLKKITEELVDNAFKFSQAGTTVQVATHGNENILVLDVTNEGRGLTEQHISHIGAYQQFERDFYEQQGLGLGLVIVQNLTKMNHGMFEIRSVPNDQTTVSISLELQSFDKS